MTMVAVIMLVKEVMVPALLVVTVVIMTVTVMVSVLKGCRTFQLDFQTSGVLKIFRVCPKFFQKTYLNCIYMEEPGPGDK